MTIPTTDGRVNHSDLSIHRCGSQTYEWGYSQNSQRKKEVSSTKGEEVALTKREEVT